MNILVFSWRDPKHPQSGGAEQVMHEHMKGWVSAGHNVTLFSSKYVGCLTEEIIDGVKVIRKGRQIFGVQIEGFKYYLKNKNIYDLVVDQFHGIPFFTPLYVKKPKLAVLQEVAREIWFFSGLPWPYSWIVGIVGYIFEPPIFLFYKKVPFMVGSGSAKKDLIKMGIPKNRIEVVSHGVILQTPEIIKKEKVQTIVFLGALTKDKGVEDAVEVFGILNKHGSYNYWIIGKGPRGSEEKLKLLAKKLRIEKNITFWGWVSNQQKFELLSKAHILINPSIREGWGLVNIEANAVKTPVVAYNSRGLVDSVKDGSSGFIVNNKTPECLANKVIELLDNPRLLEKFQKSSLDWSKKFSWDKSRKISLDIIKNICKYK